MRRVNRLPAMGLVLVLLEGCAAEHTVILVPDQDGTVGKVEVATAGGRQLLEKANDMTTVAGASTPPAPVTAADPLYVATTFADALAIEPLPAEKFILFYETGKSVLPVRAKEQLAQIVAAIKQRSAISVAISGHADAAGSSPLNDRLAQQRAELVRDLLLQNGVNPDIISVSSHGERNPLVPTHDGMAEPKNRRVEVIVR